MAHPGMLAFLILWTPSPPRTLRGAALHEFRKLTLLVCEWTLPAQRRRRGNWLANLRQLIVQTLLNATLSPFDNSHTSFTCPQLRRQSAACPRCTATAHLHNMLGGFAVAEPSGSYIDQMCGHGSAGPCTAWLPALWPLTAPEADRVAGLWSLDCPQSPNHSTCCSIVPL